MTLFPSAVAMGYYCLVILDYSTIPVTLYNIYKTYQVRGIFIVRDEMNC